ncbi:MAG: hypothetical protein ACRCZ9_00120, partial [Fusobacteriaceae bacterium]
MSEKLSLEEIKTILAENIENYGFRQMSESINDYLNEMFSALKMMEEGKGNHIAELLDIDRRFDNIRNTEMYSRQLRDEFNQKKIDDIEYILNYAGVWNKEYFCKKYYLTEEDLKKQKENIRRELYPSDSELRDKDIKNLEKQKIEKEEYIEKYYEKKVQLTSKDIKDYLKKELFFSKKQVNEENVNYPLVVKLYKGDKIVYIYKVAQKLMQSISLQRQNKDFDDYSIGQVKENIIDELIVDEKINKYPYLLNKSTITMKNTGTYRTINQVKKRYQNDFNLKFIKKIINDYNVPHYSGVNTDLIINR